MAFVLLVDDDADQLQIRKLLFERDGHRVVIAGTAASALGLFAREPTDLVFMDFRLPQVDDGLELIRGLRKLSVSVPIVVISGLMEELTHAPEAKLVNQCLRKPVRSEQILRTVKRLAGS